MIMSYKIEGRLLKFMAVARYVLTCVILLSLCACSFDEPLDDTCGNVIDSDVAYLVVNITDDAGKPLLVAASNNTENAVGDAHFYFYDEDGKFIVRGEIDPSSDDWYDGSDNTELESGTLVVLKGLTGVSYPKYLVTVLNQPTDFQYSTDLKDMQLLMSGGENSGIGSTGSFVMTTSTYSGASTNYDFVTQIKETDFFEGTASDLSNINPKVNIYVERLAAKVTVDVDSELKNSNDNITIKNDDGTTRTLYSIGNDRYVEFLGWKINAVARQSYMFKNIDPNWDDNNPWTDWNDADNYRCYWGKSFNYGLTDSDYPESNIKEGNDKGNTPTDEASYETWLNDYLEYVNLKDNLISIPGSGYCPENTNTVGEGGVIQDAESTAITSVLIKALACDAKGNALDLSGYTNGLMYYNIPIKHVNQPESDDDTFLEGEYGVVRNYHYTITINSLSGLGTPITDEDEVIVPTDTDYNLTFNISSLPWKLHDEYVDYSKQLDGDYIDITGENSGDEENSGVDTSTSNLWSVTDIDITTSH
ncbi:MAG: fimbria major subunit [Prevotella sp.]|nr:fimbria major subunit [Prevotella sp.]